jgi:hypothetical protein
VDHTAKGGRDGRRPALLYVHRRGLLDTVHVDLPGRLDRRANPLLLGTPPA